MATLSGLVGSALELIDVLDADVLPWRYVYGTPDFVSWLDGVLPQLQSTVIGSQLTPMEQVFACLDEYCSGEPVNDDRRFKCLKRTPDLSIWELKTDDIRLFGWVPAKDRLILAFGDTADAVKTNRSYGSYMAKTIYVRNNLDLDEPKFVASRNYDDVVSNKPE
jgi:hypothetical protein